MKTQIAILAALLPLAAGAYAAEGWLTDFAQAKREAVERKVPILADFSGSDWCGWCIRLDKEVFAKPEFKTYAEKNVVLFLADFPRSTSQPAEVKHQNRELSERFGIKGFPTVLLLDAGGKELARTGYRRGGAAAYVEHLKGLVPPRKDAHVAAAMETVAPLTVGASIPKVELQTPDGEVFDLNKAVAKKPTVVIFYRGGWCPYCNVHLGQLQTVEADLLKLGYQILAVSPDRPEKLRESVDKHELTYTLLSDHSMKAAQGFGIAFRVDDATLEKYKGYGIDLEAASGEKHHLLPVPAVFITDIDGTVKFAYANPDYKIRLETDALLAAAKAAMGK